MEHLSVALSALLATALFTSVLRGIARERKFLDHPNARSAHVQPTPTGGGTAIVVVVTISLAMLAELGKITHGDFGVLAGGGLAVAAVGIVDDWRQVSTRTRLIVHFGAAGWAMWYLQALPAIRIDDQMISFGWFGYPLGVLGIVWSLNLFNFMDGIDGIAASEAAFVAIAGVLLLGAGNLTAGVSLAGLVLGAACCGFLLWNWPPAAIFLGDAGSGYLGYMLACLAIILARDNPVALLVFVILGAVFIVDATVTFARRIARHERYDVGHRTHGYQRLSRRWGSHGQVTAVVLITNLALLLPAAYWAVVRPERAAYITVAALALVFGLALVVGSGRRDKP